MLALDVAARNLHGASLCTIYAGSLASDACVGDDTHSRGGHKPHQNYPEDYSTRSGSPYDRQNVVYYSYVGIFLIKSNWTDFFLMCRVIGENSYSYATQSDNEVYTRRAQRFREHLITWARN